MHGGVVLVVIDGWVGGWEQRRGAVAGRATISPGRVQFSSILQQQCNLS